ncbi:MAG: hydrolase [Oscillospiraceae bacterium]|jgi:hypothetical protein|nr:hydrolase [Oscillospiraceae bacterium]
MIYAQTQDELQFEEIYRGKIKREGADKLYDFLKDSDFFVAPASTRFHGSYEGGLLRHSLNVYECLIDLVDRPRYKDNYGFNYSEETIALVSLLHDVCKVNIYKKTYRNRKNESTGQWESYPFYEFNDNLPYGHGEKSVYMVGGFVKLTREESMAIRWHMGFSGLEEKNTIGKALEMYPLAFLLATADMEASYFMESNT